MSLGKGKRPLSQQPTILHALRVQTSAQGQVLPWFLGGRNRTSMRLLAYYDFKAIPHTSNQATGGKGFGGGKSSGNTTYTYTAAIVAALCNGVVADIRNVWDSKGKLTLQSTTETITIGAPHTVANSATFAGDDGIGVATAYSVSANDYGSDGAVTLAGTQQVPLVKVSGTPAPGQYKVVAGVYTFHASDAGKTATITYVYVVPNTTGSTDPATTYALTLITGALGQSPWGYLTTNHSAEALGYSGIALIADSAIDLGSSGTLPNLTIEIDGGYQFGAGIVDMNPADAVTLLATDNIMGPGMDAGFLGDLTAYRNYCTAAGLFVSPLYDAQSPARDLIDNLCKITNAAAFWHDGAKLAITPYGDTTIVGNGATFSPNLTPIYDLTPNDFMELSPGVAIEQTIKAPSDCFNAQQIEVLDRTNAYNPVPLEDKDEAVINQEGYFPASVITAHEFCTTSAGKTAANAINRRNVWIRASFRFKLGLRYCALEPMDIVTLTDPNLGFTKRPVRITKVDQSGDEFTCEAEEFPFGTATSSLYPLNPAGGYSPNAMADPGNVNAPIIFEANDRLSQTGAYETWIAVSGATADWGGCTVWTADDVSGSAGTYTAIGRIYGPARMGTLTATLADASGLDGTNTLSVNLTTSLGTLTGGTATDRDNFRTLCALINSDGSYELVGFKDATLTSAYHFDLTSLQRGVYLTPHSSHASGDKFVRLDNAIYVDVFGAEDVGKVIHLKFTSFNRYQANEQPLANATGYTYTIGGLYNNAAQYTGNNAMVDSVGTGGPPFTAATVRIYMSGGTPGTSAVTITKGDGTTRTVAAINFTGKALSTKYYALWNPGGGAVYLLADGNATANAVFHGHVLLGTCTTVAAGGGGGTSGGGGGFGGGGVGGGNQPL